MAQNVTYHTFTCQDNAQRTPINVVGLSAWEFRYGVDRHDTWYANATRISRTGTIRIGRCT